MTRGMCFTLVLMLCSVAAAMASPAAQWPPTHEVDAAMVVLAESDDRPPRVADACAGDEAQAYLQWHFGSAKLIPGCSAAAH